MNSVQGKLSTRGMIIRVPEEKCQVILGKLQQCAERQFNRPALVIPISLIVRTKQNPYSHCHFCFTVIYMHQHSSRLCMTIIHY